jgi:heat-inducible transcriptional repressor
MNMPTNAIRDLTDRDRAILKDVILTYILRAEPVSSRTVARHGAHGLSAASIRNVMADLEEFGFLLQPHTSAGRVPTPKAYHLYIQSMMGPQQVPQEARRYIRESLREHGAGAEELVAVASHLLSELSHQVGIVLTPALAETVFLKVEFVPLTETRVLCVVVSSGGFVDNKVIETGDPIPREELVRISNYLNENFAGQTLRATREALLSKMGEERVQMDQLLALTIQLAHQGLDVAGEHDVVLEGTTEVLNQPELADIQRVRRLFETFSEKARLAYMLSECMKGPGVRVVIGEDSDLTSELDFSLVATNYRAGDHPVGTLGIFGPSRMDYQTVIPLVDYLGETLSAALEDTFRDPSGSRA